MSSSESGNQGEHRRQDMLNDLPEEEELGALAHTIEAFEKQVFAI